MKEIQGYFDVLQSKLQSCMQTQKEAIDQAADMIVDSFLKGGRFYAFGTGHSHLIVEELYTRAGGLAFVKPILPTEMMLHEMPTKSSALERLPGYAKAILDLYPVEENDVTSLWLLGFPASGFQQFLPEGVHIGKLGGFPPEIASVFLQGPGDEAAAPGGIRIPAGVILIAADVPGRIPISLPVFGLDPTGAVHLRSQCF